MNNNPILLKDGNPPPVDSTEISSQTHTNRKVLLEYTVFRATEHSFTYSPPYRLTYNSAQDQRYAFVCIALCLSLLFFLLFALKSDEF